MNLNDWKASKGMPSDSFTEWLKTKSDQLPALFVTTSTEEMYQPLSVELSSDIHYLIARAHALHLAAKDEDCPDSDELAREVSQAIRFVTASMIELVNGQGSKLAK